jgi:hypothetical protein
MLCDGVREMKAQGLGATAIGKALGIGCQRRQEPASARKPKPCASKAIAASCCCGGDS